MSSHLGVEAVLRSQLEPSQVLAGAGILCACLQGALALESADPCRLSKRKMNVILFFELVEFGLILASEILSFRELRDALRGSFQWLRWVAPCLLAAGVLEVTVDAYFTLAVVAKSRIGWLPMSSVGDARLGWGLLPFLVTLSGSIVLVGWRLQWWLPETVVADAAQAAAAARAEGAMSQGAMGFAVGWVVAVSAVVFLVVLACDLGEDGPNYIFSIPYLWSPDDWLGDNPGTVKLWYRDPSERLIQNQFDAAAALDASLAHEGALVNEERKRDCLERAPLHIGNAIVGDDQICARKEESKSAETLHIIILVAEHLTVLPLLMTVIVAVVKLRTSLDEKGIKVLQELVDGVIILSFIEVALAIKNIVWGIRGNSESDRAVPLEIEKL